MHKLRGTRLTILAASAALALSGVMTPAAQAAAGTTSLVSVLTSGKVGYDKNGKDYDVLTAAVQAVLAAKPDSPVKVLGDGTTALTAFIPNDKAFAHLVKALTKKLPKTEKATFTAVAGLGIDTVEQVLLFHVVPGSTILSPDALKANGAKLSTALEGKVIKVSVKGTAIRLGDYSKLADPMVILGHVDINNGNLQVAHGIDAVLLPTA